MAGKDVLYEFVWFLTLGNDEARKLARFYVDERLRVSGTLDSEVVTVVMHV
jgi:hypothetical protein